MARLGIAAGLGSASIADSLSKLLAERQREQQLAFARQQDLMQQNLQIANTQEQRRQQAVEEERLAQSTQALTDWRDAQIGQLATNQRLKAEELTRRQAAIKEFLASPAVDAAKKAEIALFAGIGQDIPGSVFADDWGAKLTRQHELRMEEIASRAAHATGAEPKTVVSLDAAGNVQWTKDFPHGTQVLGGKLSGSDMQMKMAGQQVLPHIEQVRAMAATLNQKGLIGPLGSRWAEFMQGRVGAGELAAGDAETARLLGNFRAQVALLQTAAARAHAGARGAGSETLLNHLNVVTNPHSDLPSFLGALDGLQAFMEGYAKMGDVPGAGTTPQRPAETPAPSAAPGAAPAPPAPKPRVRFNPDTGKWSDQ